MVFLEDKGKILSPPLISGLAVILCLWNLQMGLAIGKAQKWWEKGLQPNMKEVTGAQDLVDSLLNAGDKLVVVDFFSPGCGGCRALHPKVRLSFTPLPKKKKKRLIWEALQVMGLSNLSSLRWMLCFYLGRSVSWQRWIQMLSSFRWTMRSINPCVTASTSMFFPSSVFTEGLMAVYAVSAVPTPRLVFIFLEYLCFQITGLSVSLNLSFHSQPNWDFFFFFFFFVATKWGLKAYSFKLGYIWFNVLGFLSFCSDLWIMIIFTDQEI